MTITKDFNRQMPSVAIVDFNLAMFGASGVAEVAIDIPENAIVIGGFIVIDTAFDSGTSDTITVGDDGDDDRYITGLDGQAAALTALTLTGYKYTALNTIDIKWTGVGTAATTGIGRLVVMYIVDGRAHFAQG